MSIPATSWSSSTPRRSQSPARSSTEKVYYSHSQYPGGLKTEVLKDLLDKEPEEAIRRAVWGMIPKNKLGRQVFKKLKVYRGPHHPHEAQNPQEYKF